MGTKGSSGGGETQGIKYRALLAMAVGEVGVGAEAP